MATGRRANEIMGRWPRATRSSLRRSSARRSGTPRAPGSTRRRTPACSSRWRRPPGCRVVAAAPELAEALGSYRRRLRQIDRPDGDPGHEERGQEGSGNQPAPRDPPPDQEPRGEQPERRRPRDRHRGGEDPVGQAGDEGLQRPLDARGAEHDRLQGGGGDDGNERAAEESAGASCAERQRHRDGAIAVVGRWSVPTRTATPVMIRRSEVRATRRGARERGTQRRGHHARGGPRGRRPRRARRRDGEERPRAGARLVGDVLGVPPRTAGTSRRPSRSPSRFPRNSRTPPPGRAAAFPCEATGVCRRARPGM